MSYEVPLVSAHSGISGSDYDRLAFRPMRGGGTKLTATVLGAIQSKSGGAIAKTGHSSPSAASEALKKGGGQSVTAKLERLIAARRGERPTTALRETGSRPVCGCVVGRDGRFRLDDDHLRTLKSIFDFFDTDADGCLSEEQVRIALAATGIPPSAHLVREIVEGGGRGGKVEFFAFVEGVESATTRDPVDVLTIQQVLGRFEDPSRDAPGHLPAHMLRHVLQLENVFGTNLTSEDVDTLFNAFGIDEGAPVQYIEFIRALTSGFVNMPRSGPKGSVPVSGGAPVPAGASSSAVPGSPIGAPPPPRRKEG